MVPDLSAAIMAEAIELRSSFIFSFILRAKASACGVVPLRINIYIMKN